MSDKKTKLDPGPTRALTDRECAKLIGATMGSCIQMNAEPEAVKRALQFTLENFDLLMEGLADMTAHVTRQRAVSKPQKD